MRPLKHFFGKVEYTKESVPKKYRNHIGKYSYGKPRILDWGEGSTLEIGKFCSISEGVTIFLGGNHRLDWITTYPFSAPEMKSKWPEAANIKGHPTTKGDVTIGNDVWIGFGATIMSGVKISDGAVIGAKAMVTKDVEPYAVVVGNPARVVRKRFSEEDITALLKVKWWDWPPEKIKQNLKVLCGPNISKLVK